jgi:hypothetical protein
MVLYFTKLRLMSHHASKQYSGATSERGEANKIIRVMKWLVHTSRTSGANTIGQELTKLCSMMNRSRFYESIGSTGCPYAMETKSSMALYNSVYSNVGVIYVHY